MIRVSEVHSPSIQGNNYTFDVASGGFSAENQLSVDQRGFKKFIQDEAASFLTPDQVMLSSSVKTVAYSGEGVTVTLVDGKTLKADYALVSFSLGVLQNDDVTWEPAFPEWKTEAVQSMTMVSSFIPSRVIHLTSRIGYLYEDLHAIPEEVLVRHRGKITHLPFQFTLLMASTDCYLRRPGSRKVSRLAESGPRELFPWVWCTLCHRHRTYLPFQILGYHLIKSL